MIGIARECGTWRYRLRTIFTALFASLLTSLLVPGFVPTVAYAAGCG